MHTHGFISKVIVVTRVSNVLTYSGQYYH